MLNDINKVRKHRNQRAYRLGEDDPDRAHPLLYGQDPRDPRGPGQGRSGRDDGLDGARARARHHDRVGGDLLRVGRQPDQHHRHARPRRLHGRGRALAARARRRRADSLWCGRRAVAVDDRRPPDEALQRPADRVHQQARSLGCGPVQGDRPAARQARAQRDHVPDPDRPRERPPGHRRSRRDEGLLLRRRQRREHSNRGHPGRSPGSGRGISRDHAGCGLDVLGRLDGGHARGEGRAGHGSRGDPERDAHDGAHARLFSARRTRTRACSRCSTP